MKRHKKITGILICAIMVCALSFIWFFPKTEASLNVPAVPAEKKATGQLKNIAKKTAPAAAVENPGEKDNKNDAELEEALSRKIIVARLNELYAGRIGNVMVQVQAIEKLIRYLQDTYPNDWQDHVFDYLTLAFPEQATALYDNYLKLAGFKEWVADNYLLLINMKATERKDLLWTKRKQFFGDDAEIIWGAEIKADHVAQSLEQINTQKEMPFNEKVNYYLVSLDSIYADRAEGYKKTHQQKAMDQFLSLENVQTDLRQMDAEEREENLARFRRSMGLDEEALNRWAELDNIRDKRWENGRAYMQARELALNEPGGPDLEYKLDELRQAYFGTEAEIIKNEEQSGMFRYKGERVYGKN